MGSKTDVTCFGYGACSTSEMCRTSAGSVSGTSLSGSVQPTASGKIGRTVFASCLHNGHQNSLWSMTRPCTAWPYSNKDRNYIHRTLQIGRLVGLSWAKRCTHSELPFGYQWLCILFDCSDHWLLYKSKPIYDFLLVSNCNLSCISQHFLHIVLWRTKPMTPA